MKRWSFFIFSLLYCFALFAQTEGSVDGYFKNISSEVKQVYINPYLSYSITDEEALKNYAWIRVAETEGANLQKRVIPSESGRAHVINEKIGKNNFSLIKGSGANVEFTENNTIKYQDQYSSKPINFHGKFKITEAYLDMYNAEFLSKIGVEVAAPVAILDLGVDEVFSDAANSVKNNASIYVRSFKEQLRISNLSKLSVEEIQGAFERIIKNLQETGATREKLTIEEYFYYVTDKVAKNAGRMQAAGFQHGVLHNQQVTLLGEMVDLGTGYWIDHPEFQTEYKTPHSPYSKFEHQPIQMQNFLFRTHAMSGEIPTALSATSETAAKHSKSLLGAILKAYPEIGQKILENNPAEFYWNRFDYYHRTFDKAYFKQNFNPSAHFTLEEGKIKPKDFVKKSKTLGPDLWVKKLSRAEIPAKNYFTDSIVEEFLSPNKSQLPIEEKLTEVFTMAPSSEVPDGIWKLKINEESQKFNLFTQDFRSKVKQIKALKVSAEKKWIKTLDLLSIQMSLKYNAAPKVLNDGLGYTWNNYLRYNWGGTNIDYLIEYGKGQCHDQCLLGNLLGDEITKEFPEFKFKMFKSKKIRTHYYLMAKLPNGEVRLVDPGLGFSNISVNELMRFPHLGSGKSDHYFINQEYYNFIEAAEPKLKCSFNFVPLPE